MRGASRPSSVATMSSCEKDTYIGKGILALAQYGE